MTRWFAALPAVAALALAGCGSPGPQMIDVSGTVKFDGQDVADGDIMFVPDDKAVGPEAGKIKDGKYSLKVRSGKNKVEVRANRLVPGKKGPMGEDAQEQYIPDKYNLKTELTADVATGKTDHPFDLKK